MKDDKILNPQHDETQYVLVKDGKELKRGCIVTLETWVMLKRLRFSQVQFVKAELWDGNSNLDAQDEMHRLAHVNAWEV
jgi:hypothetical protein